MVRMTMKSTTYGEMAAEFDDDQRAFDFVKAVRSFPEVHVSFRIEVVDEEVAKYEEELSRKYEVRDKA